MIGSLYGTSFNNDNSILQNNLPARTLGSKMVSDAASDNAETKALKRSGAIECQTCKNRKYQDGSDEMVSFKAPGHISPQASGSRVRAHEQEHVSNAYSKAADGDGKVISASVSLKTAICSECGRSYVSGGTTTTQIKYNMDNPYEENKKKYEAESLAGQFVEYYI